MKNASNDFKNAEQSSIRYGNVRVSVANNPEQINPILVANGVGTELKSHVVAFVTNAGTLLRSWAQSLTGTTSIDQNRVVSGTHPPSSGSLSAVTQPITDMRAYTRHAYAGDGSKVRLFYIRASDQALVYRDSTNDGQTFGSATVVNNAETYSICALAAVSPNLVFMCQRRNSGSTYWLDLIAFHYTAGAWQKVYHPKGCKRTRLADSSSINEFWDAPFQFDACWVNESQELAVISLIDDLAGRPSTVTYQRRFWGDFNSVEAIDFSEPERDELISIRMGNIGNCVVLHGIRTMADSDFKTTKSGVLYYSPDGIRWSDAYPTLTAEQWNWGIPKLWNGALYLIGSASVWYLDLTMLLGESNELVDITEYVKSVTVDHPDDLFSATTTAIECINPDGILNNHPFIQEGAFIRVEANWNGYEWVNMFEGIQTKPQYTYSSNGESAIQINSNDVQANLKQGVADRTIVYPSPIRKIWTWRNANELAQWQMNPSSTWGWASGSGLNWVEPIKSGTNTLLVGTGIDTFIGFSSTIKILNPSVGAVFGGSNAQVTSGLVWAMSQDKTSYYEVRCGNGITRFELWKSVLGVETKLATSSGSVTDVPINAKFTLHITQLNQLIIVGISINDEANIYDLIRYFDAAPLDGTIAGMKTITAADKPPSGTYHGILYYDWRYYSQDQEWTGEEVIRGIAVNRGIANVTGASYLNKQFTALGSDWSIASPTTAWITQGPDYFAWNGNTSVKTTIWHATAKKQDFIVDVDMQLGFTNIVADGWFGQGGIACRWDDLKQTGIYFTVAASNFGGTVNQSFIQIQVWDLVSGSPAMVGLHNIPCLHQFHIGERTNVRFVVNGPWYSVYTNGMHIGTIYEPRMQQNGLLGFHNANGGGILWGLRIAEFGLGNWDVIDPNNTLDGTVKKIAEMYHGWIRADQLDVYLGIDTTTSMATIQENIIREISVNTQGENAFTHCRILSEDADGISISGTAYSPELWRKYGRARWSIQEINGLMNEEACRKRAWQWLSDQFRFDISRDYPILPRILWEKRDVITIDSSPDEVATDLVVMAIQKQWVRETVDAAWQVSMSVRLQNTKATGITQCTYYEG